MDLPRREEAGRSQIIELQVDTREQGVQRYELGAVELVDTEQAAAGAPATTLGDPPLVAICMATYNPPLDRLLRQIESIRCQSYDNWLLIICDDGSGSMNWREIEALCAQDPRRMRLYRHERNLGFYGNFERALSLVPANAELISLADQDDEWYPEKLEVLAAGLQREPEALLAYSDMRIVDESGKVLADSYWQNRRNEYRDFSSVLIRNTVTGAASMFRRELLDVILPFPQAVGEAFHDHWIACAAMACGKLSYVPEPLYDYYQYEDSVIGHCDADPGSVFSRVRKQIAASEESREAMEKKWLSVYRRDCLRLQSISQILGLRLPESSRKSRFRLMDGDYFSMARLFFHYLKGVISGKGSDAAELGLIRGFMAAKQASRRNG